MPRAPRTLLARARPRSANARIAAPARDRAPLLLPRARRRRSSRAASLAPPSSCSRSGRHPCSPPHGRAHAHPWPHTPRTAVNRLAPRPLAPASTTLLLLPLRFPGACLAVASTGPLRRGHPPRFTHCCRSPPPSLTRSGRRSSSRLRPPAPRRGRGHRLIPPPRAPPPAPRRAGARGPLAVAR